MNRVTATILSLALAASAFAADPVGEKPKDVPLPPAVVNAENALNVAADKARATYLKAVEAEVKKLQAALEKAKQDATKAGNLELAMAIKAKQDALTVDAVVAKAAESGGDLLGGGEKMDVAKTIVGKWGNGTRVRWELFADGTGKHYGAVEYIITWKSVSDNTFEIGGGVSVRNIVVNGNTAEEITKTTKTPLQKMK